jgi:hypothetical protein
MIDPTHVFAVNDFNARWIAVKMVIAKGSNEPSHWPATPCEKRHVRDNFPEMMSISALAARLDER